MRGAGESAQVESRIPQGGRPPERGPASPRDVSLLGRPAEGNVANPGTGEQLVSCWSVLWRTVGLNTGVLRCGDMGGVAWSYMAESMAFGHLCGGLGGDIRDGRRISAVGDAQYKVGCMVTAEIVGSCASGRRRACARGAF